MLFSCGERRYAVDVNAVDEISELLPEYPLPDSFRFLRGVVTIHGKLAVVLDLSLDSAMVVAEKIRETLEKTKMHVPHGPDICKTISLGVSEFPRDTESFWQAIKFADVALYRAKETGRNRSVRFTPDMWSGDQF